jgi:hypothetical protein
MSPQHGKYFLFVKHLLEMRNAYKILVRKSGQRLLGTREDTATQYYKARRARVHWRAKRVRSSRHTTKVSVALMWAEVAAARSANHVFQQRSRFPSLHKIPTVILNDGEKHDNVRIIRTPYVHYVGQILNIEAGGIYSYHCARLVTSSTQKGTSSQGTT